jgi:hypothetical protein
VTDLTTGSSIKEDPLPTVIAHAGLPPPDQLIGMNTLAFLHLFLLRFVYQVAVLTSPNPK